MPKELIKLNETIRVVDVKWSPKQYSQFYNCEAEALFTEDPNIKFEYSEAALHFFSQGVKPSQFECVDDWRGQGFVYFVSFFKSPTGKLTGLIEFIPAYNKDDQLPGKTAAKTDFEYNGIIYGVSTEAPLTGSTGGVHKSGQLRLVILNPELYSVDSKDSKEKEFNHKLPQMAGGAFVGEKAVLGEFRVNSGTINSGTFNVNPLFLLLHCNNSIDEATGSDFWYLRIIPEPISDLLLNFLLKTLPLKEDQKREVTHDYRQFGETNAKKAKDIKNFLALTEKKLQNKLAKRLLYFSSTVYDEENYPKRDVFYNVSKVILESKKQGISLNVNVTDRAGRTPLSHLIERLNRLDDKDESNYLTRTDLLSDIETLIMFGANPFIRDKTGRTSFDYDKNPKMLLLLNKMIKDAESNNDEKLQDQCRELRRNYIYRKLQTEGSQLPDEKIYQQPFQPAEIARSLKYDTLFHTVVQHSPDLVYDTLYFMNIDLRIKDNEGLTAFDYFLTRSFRHPDDKVCLKFFLQDGADFSVAWQVPQDFQGLLISKLVHEAKHNNFKPFLLVQKNFQVNIFCKQTQFRLMDYAVIHGNLAMVTLLLNLGANPNMQNGHGNNGLQTLMLSKHLAHETAIKIAELLFKANCNPFSRNIDELSAGDLCPSFLKPLLDEHILQDNQRRSLASNPYVLCNSFSKEVSPTPAMPHTP